MRILRVAQNLYPEQDGGASYHVHALSRDQVAMGHEVTVLTTRNDQTSVRYEEREGYEIYRFKPVISPLGNHLAPGLGRFLQQAHTFDVMHVHSHLYFSSNLAALKRYFSHLPMAMTNHGLYSQSAPIFLQEMYLKTLGKWTFNISDLVFCYSEGVKQRFREKGIRSQVKVIHNGVDPYRFGPGDPTDEFLTNQGPIILSVVRLVKGKRPLDAIKAVETLKAKHPDIQLIIAGDGPLRNDLESYIQQNNLSENIHLLGNIPYDRMPDIYKTADILLLPSEEEAGAPRVVLEGMATGLPFVMTKKEHTSSIITRLGSTPPVGDINAIANAVDHLLRDDSNAEKFGEEARRVVKQNFHWDTTVKQTTRYLAELCDYN